MTMSGDFVFFTVPIGAAGPQDLDRYSWTPAAGFFPDPAGDYTKVYRRWTSGPDKGQTFTIYVLLDGPRRWEGQE